MVSWVWNGDTVRNTERHLFSWILKSRKEMYANANAVRQEIHTEV